MFEKIKLVVVNSQMHYLNEVISKSAPDKYDGIKAMFDTHMNNISNYCIENYIDKTELTEDFIKGLHKILYPIGYKIDTVIGGKRAHMVPGEYKIYDNGVDSLVNPGTVNQFVSSKDTEKEMKKLINNFNTSLTMQISNKEKKDIFFWFALDLTTTHPFGDGNGRVATILLDLFMIKYNLNPVYFHFIKEKDYKGTRIAGEKSIKSRDLKYLYEIIEKYSEC